MEPEMQAYMSNTSIQEDNINHHHVLNTTPIHDAILFSPSWQVPLVVALSLLIILTIIGNIFILVAIATHKPLRVPQNYLLSSLAISDLLVAGIMPISLVKTVFGDWIFSPTVCNLWISMDVLYCTASILNLCVVSLDRYWAITDPVKYSSKRTAKRMFISIAIVWAIAVVISVAPLFGQNSGSDLEHSLCEISQNIYYTIFSTFGAFFVPATIILVVYYRISIEARKRIRNNIPKSSVPMLLLNKASVSVPETSRYPISAQNSPLPDMFPQTFPNGCNSNQNAGGGIQGEASTTSKKPQLYSKNSIESQKSSTESRESSTESHNFTEKQKSLKPHLFSKDSTESQASCTESQRSSTITWKPELLSKDSTESQMSCESHCYIENRLSRQGSLQEKNGYTKKKPRLSFHDTRKTSWYSPPVPRGRLSQQSIGFYRGSNPSTLNSPTHGSLTSRHSCGSLTSLALEERMKEKRALAAAREHRATRTVFIVTGSFLICWLPFFLAALILPLCKHCHLPQVYKNIFLWLGYFNSMLNPIIYTIFNKDFNDAVNKMNCFSNKRIKKGIRGQHMPS